MKQISIEQVCDLIDDRSEATSVIRLGDGEAGLFASLEADEMCWPLTSDEWRYRYLMDQDWKSIGKALFEAVPQATVVGVPARGTLPEGKVPADFVERLGLHREQKTCSCHVNTDMVFLPACRNRMRSWIELRRVGIFYHDTVMARRRYAHILGFPEDVMRKIVPMTFPFRSVIGPAVTFAKSRIDLALVSGGPAGKVLCVELQKIGIDSFDMGQAIDRFIDGPNASS